MQLVAGAADPLEPARDRLRRLDLDHEVDGAHVDAELERRRGDEARDPARLQVFLDQHPLLARQAAVVGARDFALGELVQAEREPLGEPAVVDEHDRRAVRLDQAQELGVHRGPDRLAAVLGARVHHLAVGGHRVRERAGRVELAQVLDRHDDLEVELLASCPHRRARIGRLPETKRPISASGRWVADRPMRCERLRRQPLEPLDRERQMGAALRAGDRVHLVEDQRLDRPERLAGGGGEHEVERLGRRDQDVGRLLDERGAARGCRVSPVRTPTRSLDSSPASGPRRLRSMS